MFYEELYTELGKLFYHIAAADGKVTPAEKQSLQQLIQTNWIPLEESTDEYGTDQASRISFSFDYEEAEGSPGTGLQSFEAFYLQNKSEFTPAIISNILKTGNAIASAYRSQNKQEEQVLNTLNRLLKS